VLHPEVSATINANVARSTEEADSQRRGERIGEAGDDEDDEQRALETAEAMFDNPEETATAAPDGEGDDAPGKEEQ